jgi:hypothetical protein
MKLPDIVFIIIIAILIIFCCYLVVVAEPVTGVPKIEKTYKVNLVVQRVFTVFCLDGLTYMAMITPDGKNEAVTIVPDKDGLPLKCGQETGDK